MVSFFGLKIGGEKKKKTTKELQISAPQPQHPDDSNAIDNGFIGFNSGPKPAYEASVYSLSRPGSGQSARSIRSKFRALKAAPFASNKFGSSMVDLPTPPSLRHHASNPSLGRRWNTGSSTSLNLAPPSFNPMARPSTSDNKSRPWVNPLDVHFTRDSSTGGFNGPLSPALTMRDEAQPVTPLSATPRSPLGQYELKLDLPSDVSSFADLGNFDTSAEAPAPLRIKKPALVLLAAESQTESWSPQKPPSPPQSIDDREPSGTPAPEPTKLPPADVLPPSTQSHHSIPSDLEELRNVISNFGPDPLPSPSTTPRVSEEKPPSAVDSHKAPSPATKKGAPKPVIQNVLAKRDTLTINPERRHSLQMRIEATEGGTISSVNSIDKPKILNSGRSFDRPPPLKLNMGFHLNRAEGDGPRSAPFLPNPRLLTPTSAKSPLRMQVGVQEDPDGSGLTNGSGEQNLTVNSPTGSSVYDEDEDHAYDYPPSPESTSPVIPLTGPLASPRFPPLSQSPRSTYSTFAFPRNEETEDDHSLSPTTPPIPPRSLRRNPPTPDSSYWPLSSPFVSSDRAALSPSPADSRLRSESESESLSRYEPLEPPHIPAARPGAESPTFRSFSRPWTPIATGESTTSPLKRAETAKPLRGLRKGGDLGEGLRPPPRSVTVKTPRTDVGSIQALTPEVKENGLVGRYI
ncbi:hypothetical protein F4802DRAFT_175965 [Xylaria palmicola]|nr:hypothetical protein F4802DRAFT_175965 [Xylaria palmicola]